jgi:hypothetical protein
MAKRLYISDWAYQKVKELSARLDKPIYMIIEEALLKYEKEDSKHEETTIQRKKTNLQ